MEAHNKFKKNNLDRLISNHKWQKVWYPLNRKLQLPVTKTRRGTDFIR